MKKHTKGIDSYPAANRLLARAVHISWPYDDIGNPKLLAVLANDVVLVDFGKTIRFAAGFGPCLHGAIFIQLPTPGFVPVRIHRKRAYIDESPQALMLDTAFKK